MLLHLYYVQDGNNQGGNELQAVGNRPGKLPDHHDALRPREADQVHLLPQGGEFPSATELTLAIGK